MIESEGEMSFDHQDSVIAALRNPTTPEKQYTIFLVDNEPGSKEATMNELSKSPHVYNVQYFETGTRLMDYLSEVDFFHARTMHKLPILVILDIQMPGMAGLRILRMLKAHPMTRDIPIIMSTTDKSSPAMKEAYMLQAGGYILKPMSLMGVHDMIIKQQGREMVCTCS